MRHRNLPMADRRSVIDEATQLVDVREPREVASGTLDGAVNIPLDRLGDRIGELDPTRRVVLFCRSGRRSESAAGFLTGAGFDDVINLDGGMLAYQQELTS